MFSTRKGARPPAVIMGLGHPRQTAFLTSLSRVGVSVHAAHTEVNEHRHSRRLTAFHHLAVTPEEQLAQLDALGRKLGGAVLIPTNDDYVALVAKNRGRLARHFTITLPAWDIVGPIMDREHSYRVAASTGVKVPRYWSPESDAALSDAVGELAPHDHDYILKTRTVLGSPADESSFRQTTAAPRDRGKILQTCLEMKQRTGSYPLIQEVIPGGADSAIGVSMVVSPTRQVLLSYCVRRLRLMTYKLKDRYIHPYELGAVVWCETVHDDEAVDAARQLVRRFDYVGPVTVEFRRSSTDGALYFMKMEPRPVRATSLSTAIGLDIPTTLYDAFTGRPRELGNTYEAGVGWLWIQVYVASLIRNRHRTRQDLFRLLKSLPRIKSFGEDLWDPVPNVYGAARLLARAARRRLERSLRPAAGVGHISDQA
jgi:predicted ATP-grasp superfamily ATP-dependent carboligase